MSEITRNPLCWPNNVARTAPHMRSRPAFKCPSISVAIKLILEEVNRLNGRSWHYVDDDVIISTNLRLRRDNLPAGDQAQPADTGAAVYFQLHYVQSGKPFQRPIVMTCDKWARIEWNLRAIAMDIEAQRARARWGCTDMRQAFQGYVAIPEKCGGDSWWDVLAIKSTAGEAEIIKAFNAKAKVLHPDLPTGNAAAFQQLQEAKDQALAQFKN